ncbi:MAG: HAMP domain-containing protein [Alphaproteobacteria bacterium]|nr:HAMP domain-containing protein [Alphaproteobacteria bacterium]
MPRLLRTSVFRIAAIYLALFGGSSIALLAFVFWSVTEYVKTQTESTISIEITGLAEHYRQNGLVGLRDVLAERSRNQRQSLYLLTDSSFRPIIGNLDQWPLPVEQTSGWFDFDFDRPGSPAGVHHARARHLQLAGGFQLLVGRDVQERTELLVGLRDSLSWAGLLVVVLAVAGGLAMGRNTLRRVDAIARTSQDIIAGDWSRRMPLTGSNDEFDRLAQSLNAMLDQIERLVGGLQSVSDNIAHDLRTPLTRLRTRLEATLMAPSVAPESRHALEQSIADADRLLAMFTALLDIARAESGVLRREMGPVDLAAVCRDVADLYAPTAEERSTPIRSTLPQPLIVHGHRALLAQALANLLDNAIKFSPKGGTITLTLERAGEEASVMVADRGPGIAAGDRDRAVERFTRLEESRGTPGAGLGLSLAKAVADLHRGRLILADNSPGLRAILRIPVGPSVSL